MDNNRDYDIQAHEGKKLKNFKICFVTIGMTLQKKERRDEKGEKFNHNAGEKTRDTSRLGRANGRGTGNIARIINHTQVTIINDIQHNGSNVGKKRRRNERSAGKEEEATNKKNDSNENLCLI